tara:strand:+ start:264 stop:1841 length:1578 start_codon:yes stop_codon:yes gene_type:complete
MDKLTVLITTSGLGSRLGEKTKYINKALIRVGDKPIISHILNFYKKNTEFIITIGHKGDLVKQYLKLAHSNLDIKYVEIDKYDGKGSSLLYSMSLAKKHLQRPFVFHVSDAIIDSDDSLDYNKNFIVGSKNGDPSYYSSFNIKNSFVENIFSKGEIDSDFNYVGVANIIEYKSFWEKTEFLLTEDPNDNSLNDVKVFDLMIKSKIKIRFYDTKNWLDTGSINGLNNAKEKIKPKLLKEVLDKPNESIYYINGEVIKFFSESSLNLNRVKRAKLLNPIVPEINDSTDNFFKYSLVDGKLFSKVVNDKTFDDFLNFSKNNLWLKSESNIKIENICKEFYFDKTLQRVEQFFKKKSLSDDINKINGIKVPTLKSLIDKIPLSFYKNGITSRVHGDFIIDNCIKTKDSFKMIDWRQDFGGNLEVGDIYYDFSKLAHNLVVNHEMIDNDFYFIDKKDSNIIVEIYRKNNLVECENLFFNWINKNNFDINRVKILRALIWINMSPLHHKPFDEFLFYFGKLNLYKALKLYD